MLYHKDNKMHAGIHSMINIYWLATKCQTSIHALANIVSGQTPLSPCLRGVYIPIERKQKKQINKHKTSSQVVTSNEE